MTRRETNLIVATAVLAIASLLTAIAAVTLVLVVRHRDQAQMSKIRALEHQTAVLCARTTVSGVKLVPGGRAKVSTARGC